MKVLVSYLLFLVFVSCASKQIIIDKSFKPFEEFSQVTKVNVITADLNIISVEDQSSMNDYIGEGLTGVYFSKTPIAFEKNKNDFVKEYFKNALRQRNISLSDSSSNNLNITINKLWVTELIEKYQGERAICEANFTFDLQMANGSSWNGTIWTKITSAADLGDGTDKLSSTMSSCMNQIVEKLMTKNQFIQNLR
ncbi:MAG: hypothetical protein N4A33_03550 [Bacteriovoracaceae bacterium]|jgi:hypothetical protein|nr:hypothetical protein [Bacteriovoracaceae bacterium]